MRKTPVLGKLVHHDRVVNKVPQRTRRVRVLNAIDPGDNALRHCLCASLSVVSVQRKRTALKRLSHPPKPHNFK